MFTKRLAYLALVGLALGGLLGCSEGYERVSRTALSKTIHHKKFPKRRLSVAFSDAGHMISIHRGDQQKQVAPPEGCFWSAPVFTPEGQYAFVIANERTPTGGYSSDAIFRIKLPGAAESFEELETTEAAG